MKAGEQLLTPECCAGLLQQAVSKGSAQVWVCAGLQSSQAPTAPVGGLTRQTFLGSVLRGRLRGKEAGRTFWGSISAFCVLLEVSAD